LPIVLGLVFTLQLASHVAYRLERMQGGLVADEVRSAARSLPGHVVRAPLATGELPRGEVRVPLPQRWTEASDRKTHERLALFVDDQRVSLLLGEADDRVPLPRAVLRSRRAGAVLVPASVVLPITRQSRPSSEA
jgi:hypothetical protein